MSHSSRREFLKTSAVIGAGYFVAGRAAADDSKSPNERVRFACIGVDGKGASDSGDAGKLGDVVAICDVDDKKLNAAGDREELKKAKKYNDFRKMLDEVHGSIDAVTVSIPDHCHAPASSMAMRMGKACFTQKPLTRTIGEARKLGEIAREMKVATQMGNQGTSFSPLRKTASLVQTGILGPIKEVHIWTNRPIWPQGMDLPAPATPPSDLHWDLWLGPAHERPYGEGYHPFKWRGWWDFGSGALGDMACHTVNMPFMALDLRNPTSVHAETSGHNRESFPERSVIEYQFPANDKRPAVQMTWYDGGKLPKRDLIDVQKLDPSGVIIIGEKGKLYAPGDYCEKGYKLFGVEDPKDVKFEESPGHFEEFIRAVKGGPQARSNFPDYAGPLTETILLGNLAVWADGKTIEWDAKKLEATNAPDVMGLVHPKYRDGYTL
jgi:predicted dehydrogenase